VGPTFDPIGIAKQPGKVSTPASATVGWGSRLKGGSRKKINVESTPTSSMTLVLQEATRRKEADFLSC